MGDTEKDHKIDSALPVPSGGMDQKFHLSIHACFFLFRSTQLWWSLSQLSLGKRWGTYIWILWELCARLPLVLIIYYLFLNFDLEFVFHHLNQVIFATGVQHPLADATLVPWHRINEDCKKREKLGEKTQSNAESIKNWYRKNRLWKIIKTSAHLWTPSSRLRGNVCRGRSGIAENL